MNRESKFLFIYTNFSTFVKTDYKILNKIGNISKFQYQSSKNIKSNIYNQIKLLIFLIRNIFNSDLIYIWFADYHSLLPILYGKIFRKKTMLVLGGYDVANIPEFKYGTFNKPLRAFFGKHSILNATVCLPVSLYIANEAVQKVGSFKYNVVYNAINFKKYEGELNKDNIFLTVASCNNDQRLKIKGVYTFIKLAKYFPDYQFYIVGIGGSLQKKMEDIPSNVQLFEPVSLQELIEYYKKAKYYCQLSVVEAFSLAVMESLSFNAIPIISNRGALPELYKEVAITVDIDNMESMIETIKSNIPAFIPTQEKINKIIGKYSLENRTHKILYIINSIFKQS